MFENKKQPVISRKKFFGRFLRFTMYSLLMILISLMIGMWGYHYYASISWVDAFYNASMILTGMGPALDIEQLAPECRNPSKIFAGCYALFSGVIFISAAGLIISPLLHRFFHILHMDEES